MQILTSALLFTDKVCVKILEPEPDPCAIPHARKDVRAPPRSRSVISNCYNTKMSYWHCYRVISPVYYHLTGHKNIFLLVPQLRVFDHISMRFKLKSAR